MKKIMSFEKFTMNEEFSDEDFEGVEEVEEIDSPDEFKNRFRKPNDRMTDVTPTENFLDSDDEDEENNTPIEVSDEDAEGAELIDSPNSLANRYRLQDGRVVDVMPNGNMMLVNESLKGEELLSKKQRKLPEGLKKGIIAKMKKAGKKVDDDECDDECDDKKKGKKGEDKKDEKKDKKSGSDEEKYLSPKQRKLPEGLKKGIIARAKKSKKVNESDNTEIDLIMMKFDLSENEAVEIIDIVDEICDIEDLDERIDYVDGLDIESIVGDEEKALEIRGYLMDQCTE